MNLRERASEIAEAIEKNNIDGSDLIESALREVESATIERCAKICDDHHTHLRQVNGKPACLTNTLNLRQQIRALKEAR